MAITIDTPDLDELYVAVRATADLPPTLSTRRRRKALRELAQEALAAVPQSGEWGAAAACAYIGAEAKFFLYTPDLLKKAVLAGKAEGDEIARATAYCHECPVIASCYVWADKRDPEYRGIAAGQIWIDQSKKNGRGSRRAHYRPTPALLAELSDYAARVSKLRMHAARVSAEGASEIEEAAAA